MYCRFTRFLAIRLLAFCIWREWTASNSFLRTSHGFGALGVSCLTVKTCSPSVWGSNRKLGETISRRLAAKLLGVSHTALERWIESGDVPLVFTVTGRQEVSVAALLDLYEAVHFSKTDGTVRHPLAAALKSRQHAAERLNVDWPHDRKESPYDSTHLRGLAYHQVVAGRLQNQTVAEAKYILYRWREQGRIDPVYAERWDRVLAMPLTSIRDAITADGVDADDLRQNSPFAGALTEPERRRILAEVG